MKKASKVLSYVLSLALIVSLFSGLGFKSEPAKAAAGDFTVLEIVPNAEMATFGYFVEGQEPTINGQGVADNCKDYGDIRTFLTTDTGCGSYADGVYTSNNLFVTRVLDNVDPTVGVANWNVTVNVKTPNTVGDEDINGADLIVINQTVPEKLKISAIRGLQETNFYENDFDWNTVYKIFKRIAGVEGKPVPYIIDFRSYYIAEKDAGSNYHYYGIYGNSYDGNWTLVTDSSNDRFGFTAAQNVHILNEEADAGTPVDHGTADKPNMLKETVNYVKNGSNVFNIDFAKLGSNGGSGKQIYKLFTLLTSMNPSSLYGIYFAAHEDDYGIDADGNLLAVGTNYNNNVRTYNMGRKFSKWGETHFLPYFMTTASKSIADIKTSLGWTDLAGLRGKADKEFSEKIGGGNDGCGILYNSAENGLAYIMKYNDPSVKSYNISADGTTGTVNSAASLTELVKNRILSTFYSALGRDAFIAKCASLSINVTSVRSAEYTITANGKTYVFSDVDGYKELLTDLGVASDKVDAVTEFPYSENLGYSEWLKGEVLTKIYGVEWNTITSCSYVESYKLVLADGTEESVDFTSTDSEKAFISKYLSCPASDIKSSAAAMKSTLEDKYELTNVTVTETPASELGDGANKQAAMIASFRNNTRVDYHPYRFLVVSDGTADASANRSMIADMVSKANALTHEKGLVGGIRVDCVSKYLFTNMAADLDQTYDAVYYVGSDESLTGATKGTDASFISDFESLLSTSFGICYKTTPTEYYSGVTIGYRTENGSDGYFGSGSNRVTDNLNYINNKNHSARTLDFDFKITGGGSSDTYTVELYVDRNNDSLFSTSSIDSDKTNGEMKVLESGLSKGDRCKKEVSIETFMGKDYVGGFAWKLVVRNNHGVEINRTGYSACRTDKDKATIKILQIYPTDYTAAFGDNAIYPSNPMLLLPTQDEINIAKNGGTNVNGQSVSARGSITGDGYNVNTDIGTLFKYFSGVMTVDVATASGTKGVIDGYNPHETMTWTDGDDSRTNLLGNSAFLYYFLEKLEDFELDVDRYSVYGFSNHYSEFQWDAKNKKLGKMSDSKFISNAADGSDRYLYTASQLALPSDWQEKTVTWDGTQYPKYLVSENSKADGTKYIYGERNATAESYHYYGAKENGKDGLRAGELELYDIMVLGFGHNMDHMDSNAVEVIYNYLNNGGPALVGYGTVTPDTNNNLGSRIKGLLGMTSTETSGNKKSDKSVGFHTMMIDNDTLFSHYPYKVNRFMKNSDSNYGAYKLSTDKLNLVTGNKIDSSDPKIVVSYSKHKTNQDTWGDCESQYYLYKKGNITYCGFGDTFANSGLDQVGMTMTMAENVMIVNALVTTSRYKSGSDYDDPYFNCVDADRGIMKSLASSLEDDQKQAGAKGKYTVYDGVYTDYSAYGISHYTTGLGQDDGLDALKSESLKPAANFPDTRENIRWVKYEATLTVSAAQLVIKTTDNKDLPLVVYKRVYDTATKGYTYTLASTTTVNVNGASRSACLIDGNGIYYIGVPVVKDSYSEVSTSSKLGFTFDKSTGGDTSTNVDKFDIDMSLYAEGKEIEVHHLNMIRRVLYEVD